MTSTPLPSVLPLPPLLPLDKRRHGSPALLEPRDPTGWRDDTGAVTAEYAVVLLAAVAFAGLLATVLRSGAVQTMLTDLVQKALTSV